MIMDQESFSEERPAVDIHIHLAGTGCCQSGIWMSPKLRQRYTIKLLQWVHKISNKRLDDDFDDFWLAHLQKLIMESQRISLGVILGFDGHYHEFGKYPDLDKSQLIIPAAWVFNAAKKYPQFLPGPSINPLRHDALDLLDYVIENKAVLIKWLPSAQGIDPAYHNLKSFFRKLAQAHIPLLIHVGGERTFLSLFPDYNRAEKLYLALDEGVKVIAAHSGTRVLGSREPDDLPLILKLLENYPNLWLDNSGLANPSRFRHLVRLAEAHPLVKVRTLYGSDYPVPSDAYYYLFQLSLQDVVKMQKIRNQLDRDVSLKEKFGYPKETLTRAHQVLCNIDYWQSFHSS